MIERIDQQRMSYLKWYLIGFALFMVLMLTRHFFRMDGLNSQPVGIAVLIGLICTLLMQIVFLVRSTLLEKDIRKNPLIQSALNNELVKSLEVQAWIAAYIGSAGMTIFFAITWFFYPICDPVTIALASIATGAGANRAFFYFRYKSS
jgi:hypothetical protein